MSANQLIIVALVGLALPVISARIVRAHWDPSITGLITGALAALDGVVAEGIRAAQAGQSFDFAAAAGPALLAWLAAVGITQRGVLSGTQLEARLLEAGSKKFGDDDEIEDPTRYLDYDDADPAEGDFDVEVDIDDAPEDIDGDAAADDAPVGDESALSAAGPDAGRLPRWAGPEHAAPDR